MAPVDVSDPEALRWLECCVWPDQPERLARLRAAAAVARRHPPEVVRGDLVDDLAAAAAGAPPTATLVVVHSAVLAYVDVDRRRAFAAAVAELGATWVWNEAPAVMAPLLEVPAPPRGFVVGRDATALAVADPHGRWVEWRDDAPAARVPALSRRSGLTSALAVRSSPHHGERAHHGPGGGGCGNAPDGRPPPRARRGWARARGGHATEKVPSCAGAAAGVGPGARRVRWGRRGR